MLLEFEKIVADFIKAEGLFGPADKILLAVSGGADSTALLYALCAIKAEGIFSGGILCAHMNHQLRGAESDGDETFVIAQADKLKLAVITRRLDVRGFADKNKLSIETAARKLRIENLLDIAQTNDCRWIATAHQKNDNAETIIQRLARGTGFRGLGGIWPVRKFSDGVSFVRPMLCVSRDEIVEYLKKRKLKWREDRTNIDCKYRRNFIRHRLIPVLQRQSSGRIVEQLAELSQSAQKFYGLVCNEAEKIRPRLADCTVDSSTLDLKSFSALHPAVKVEVARRSLIRLGSGEGNLTHQHYEKVLQLAQQKTSDKTIELPDGIVVWCEYGKLIFARAEGVLKREERGCESIELEVPGQTKFGRYLAEASVCNAGRREFEKFKAQKTNFVEWFDLDKINLPLVIRFRQGGDKFWPLGLEGEKKVGKFLTAARVPREVRKKTLIVADAGKVIWVWPFRICEQAKVTSTTRKTLQLQIMYIEQVNCR